MFVFCKKQNKFSGGGVKQYIENIAGSSNLLRGIGDELH